MSQPTPTISRPPAAIGQPTPARAAALVPLLVLVLAVLVLAVLAAACSTDEPATAAADDAGGERMLVNLGGEPLEGHTPQGFAGSGTGLFAGDNLNPNFPDGDGVQLFVAFELPSDLDQVSSAILTSDNMTVRGTPFESLGSLRAEPVSFPVFGPEVFDSVALADGVACERNGDSGLRCDVSQAAADAVADGRSTLQLRLRFDTPGDGDGEQDLALFFLTDSNTNEPGIFTLILD